MQTFWVSSQNGKRTAFSTRCKTLRPSSTPQKMWPQRAPGGGNKESKAAENRRNSVRNYIASHGITVKEFAAAAGIAKTTLSRFLNGHTQTGSYAYTLSARYMKSHRG